MVQIGGARDTNLGLKVEHFQTWILSFEKISFRLLQSSKGHEKLKESFSNIGDTLRVIRMDTAFPAFIHLCSLQPQPTSSEGIFSHDIYNNSILIKLYWPFFITNISVLNVLNKTQTPYRALFLYSQA